MVRSAYGANHRALELGSQEPGVKIQLAYSKSHISNLEPGNPPEGWESEGQFRNSQFEIFSPMRHVQLY